MIKCVIWDLDNTIWEGILSENENVKLRDNILEILAFFNERGIINSISSRNDYEAAIAKLNEFCLLEFFILPQISWADKSKGVKEILENLHLRSQNVLFVDDNPFERDEVKFAFPDINVHDGSDLKSLMHYGENNSGISSSEAKQRIELYMIEEKRILDSKKFQGSNIDFLNCCGIKLSVEMAKEEDINRIRELIERTNQLNSTGFRYTRNEIISMLADDSYSVYVATVWDKYGSYGRSGLIISKINNGLEFEISLLIVSCRLMGKGIAQALMAYAVLEAKRLGCHTLCCLFKRNAFNRQMILLYTMNGFLLANSINGVDYYKIDITSNSITMPEWISLDEAKRKSWRA